MYVFSHAITQYIHIRPGPGIKVQLFRQLGGLTMAAQDSEPGITIKVGVDVLCAVMYSVLLYNLIFTIIFGRTHVFINFVVVLPVENGKVRLHLLVTT